MNLSIIIVEYYCLEDLRRCLNSIFENITGTDYEIIVPSNSNYTKGEQEKLKKAYSFVKWVFTGKNLGFAKSVNIGIQISCGKYLLILNPDTILLDNNISLFLQYIENNSGVGIIAPMLVNTDGEIQDSYRSFITPFLFISRVISRFVHKTGKQILDKRDYDSIQTADWVSGACMLVRREAIEKVGVMDERYFLYMEDMDWCKRFWDNDLKVVYWPRMVIQHDATRGSSVAFSKGILDKYARIHFISYLKYFWKFFPKSLFSYSNKRHVRRQ